MKTITRVAVAMMLPVASASGQTFSHIITETVALGEMEHVFVVADLNGDALDDIVVGDQVDHDPDFTPADRLTKVPLHIFVSDGDGAFTHAPELVDGQIEAHAAVVVAADFNGDGKNDLVVYDHGAYVDSASSGHGNPPQLFLSSDDGVLHPSDDLAHAVREQHEREPPFHMPAAPSDLHLKTATTGDIENDGDIDLWVESDGGNNMKSHFAVNNGDGTFTLDVRNRATDLVHHNSPPTWWRYHEALSWTSTMTATPTWYSGSCGIRRASTSSASSWSTTAPGPSRRERNCCIRHSTTGSRASSESPASISIGMGRTTC